MTPNELNEIKAKLLKHDRLPRPDAIRIIGKLVRYVEELEAVVRDAQTLLESSPGAPSKLDWPEWHMMRQSLEAWEKK